jgi:hypothetical protein
MGGASRGEGGGKEGNKRKRGLTEAINPVTEQNLEEREGEGGEQGEERGQGKSVHPRGKDSSLSQLKMGRKNLEAELSLIPLIASPSLCLPPPPYLVFRAGQLPLTAQERQEEPRGRAL